MAGKAIAEESRSEMSGFFFIFFLFRYAFA
jgi:hypothetical protein